MSIAARRFQRARRPVIVPPTGPLTISNVNAVASGSNLTISWNTSVPANSQASVYFGPAKHASWNWQLMGTIDTTADAQVYDFDAFDNSATLVSQLKARQIYCIAYFSAGSWEDWRSDAASFPASVKGNDLGGWPGEKWLDVRQLDVLRPIMAARADIAKAKGFNAIEWDNLDGYSNNPGFPFTQADSIAYCKMLAQICHERGLAAFHKNSTEIISQVQPYFEGVVGESAYRWNEAGSYSVFTNANKPVLLCEYRAQDVSVANQNDANAKGFSMIYHNIDLNSKYLASYVTNPPAPVVLTNTASPKIDAASKTNHSMTFTGLTPGQQYGYLVWSSNGSETVYDQTPRTVLFP